MIYYLYEIKNLINNKIYLGVHKTLDINDGYMGSGKVIKCAIEKYGIEYFEKTILETFTTSEEMYLRERELVTAEFLNRADVYNLRCGGTGGFDYINQHGLQKVARKNANDTLANKYGEDFLSIIGKKGSDVQKCNGQLAASVERLKKYAGHKTEQQKINAISAMSSTESIAKKKITWQKTKRGQGITNSQYGTKWITDGTINKKINKADLIPCGWCSGRTVR